jgi:hypothetical protein
MLFRRRIETNSINHSIVTRIAFLTGGLDTLATCARYSTTVLLNYSSL